MNIVLNNKVEYNGIQQILYNRGIPKEEWLQYLNTTDAVIKSPLLFGVAEMRAATKMLLDAIQNLKPTVIVVDADCDGFTSSALLMNYLHRLFPTWVDNYVSYYIHEGKQHGLNDCYNKFLRSGCSLVIVPDAGSNDNLAWNVLKEYGIKTIILDHHEVDIEIPLEMNDVVIINNQSSPYPNKELSGVGVTWQFCRHLDDLIGKNYADDYIDLVAVGNIADMMKLSSLETKHLIQKGLADIHNPFLQGMVNQNSYSIGDKVTPFGVAFYVAPYINAMVRSGTQAEKYLVFESILEYKSYEEILSNKRGHKQGEMEPRVTQALRTCTNVKNRQTRAEDAAIPRLLDKVKMLETAGFNFYPILLEKGEIEPNIAGLCANKIMADCQKSICILTYNPEADMYVGSCRGCEKAGVDNFKAICESTGLVEFATGHASAFGIGVKSANMHDFCDKINKALIENAKEFTYYVDFMYKGNNSIDLDTLETIAEYDSLYGIGFEEPLFCLKDITITQKDISLLGLAKGKPTLKISLANGLELIKFKFSEEEYNNLVDKIPQSGGLTMDIIGTASISRFRDNETIQLKIKDYEAKAASKYIF